MLDFHDLTLAYALQHGIPFGQAEQKLIRIKETDRRIFEGLRTDLTAWYEYWRHADARQ